MHWWQQRDAGGWRLEWVWTIRFMQQNLWWWSEVQRKAMQQPRVSNPLISIQLTGTYQYSTYLHFKDTYIHITCTYVCITSYLHRPGFGDSYCPGSAMENDPQLCNTNVSTFCNYHISAMTIRHTGVPARISQFLEVNSVRLLMIVHSRVSSIHGWSYKKWYKCDMHTESTACTVKQ